MTAQERAERDDRIMDWIEKNDLRLYGGGISKRDAAILATGDLGFQVSVVCMRRIAKLLPMCRTTDLKWISDDFYRSSLADREKYCKGEWNRMEAWIIEHLEVVRGLDARCLARKMNLAMPFNVSVHAATELLSAMKPHLQASS